MPGCISNLCSVSSADSTMKGGLGSAPSAALGCWRKKGVFTYYRAASSQSVQSYKFTSQTLTGLGFLCLLSGLLSLWKAGDVAMPGGGLGRAGLPGKGPATPSSRSRAALLTKCLLEATSLPIPAPKATKPSQHLPSTRSEHLPQFCLPPPPCQLTLFSSSAPTPSANKHQEGGSVSPITTALP